MNMKYILVAVLVVAAGAGFWWYTHQGTVSVPAQGAQPSNMRWQFVDAGTDEATGAPKTTVYLAYNETKKEVGTYIGSCSNVQAEVLQQNEIMGALCWFAGSGDELGVFKEGDTYVVKHGEQSEGNEVEVGFRGNFKTLFQI